MKRLLAALTILLALSVTASGSSLGGEPRVIETQKTRRHKQIFEIPLFVALPEKSSLINTPTGAADNQLRYTLDASVIYAPLESLLKEFPEEKLIERGLELKSYSEFIWNGSRAVLMKVFQPLGREKTKAQWILAIDRRDHTWLANGAYDAKNERSAIEVLEILKSTWWDKSEDMPVSSETANSGIDTAGTPFRLAKKSSGALIYTKDGQLPTKAGDGAIFVASKIENAHIANDKQAEFAKTQCVKAALENELEIISEKSVNINGRTMLEIVARADSEEEETIIYQTMIFGVCENYNTMVGIAQGGAENIEYFKKLSRNCVDKFGRR